MKTTRVVTAIIVVALVLAARATAAETRTWTSVTGKTKIEAEMLRVEGGSVVLKTKDGRELPVAIDQLSPADQEYLKRFTVDAGGDEDPKDPPKVDPAHKPGPAMPAERRRNSARRRGHADARRRRRAVSDLQSEG